MRWLDALIDIKTERDSDSVTEDNNSQVSNIEPHISQVHNQTIFNQVTNLQSHIIQVLNQTIFSQAPT